MRTYVAENGHTTLQVWSMLLSVPPLRNPVFRIDFLVRIQRNPPLFFFFTDILPDVPKQSACSLLPRLYLPAGGWCRFWGVPPCRRPAGGC